MQGICWGGRDCSEVIDDGGGGGLCNQGRARGNGIPRWALPIKEDGRFTVALSQEWSVELDKKESATHRQPDEAVYVLDVCSSARNLLSQEQ